MEKYAIAIKRSLIFWHSKILSMLQNPSSSQLHRGKPLSAADKETKKDKTNKADANVLNIEQVVFSPFTILNHYFSTNANHKPEERINIDILSWRAKPIQY